MVIIGFMGKKGSGKSTAADHLVNRYRGFRKVSFAEPLKEACRSLFMLSEEQLYGNLKETPDPRWGGCTPRQLLQYIGTDLIRNQIGKIMPEIGENIFVERLKLYCSKEEERYQSHGISINFVLEDVRFQNEVDAIHQLGGIVVKIERNSSSNPSKGIRSLDEDLHSSEIEMEMVTDYEVMIPNNTSLEDFLQKVEESLHTTGVELRRKVNLE